MTLRLAEWYLIEARDEGHSLDCIALRDMNRTPEEVVNDYLHHSLAVPESGQCRRCVISEIREPIRIIVPAYGDPPGVDMTLEAMQEMAESMVCENVWRDPVIESFLEVEPKDGYRRFDGAGTAFRVTQRDA